MGNEGTPDQVLSGVLSGGPQSLGAARRAVDFRDFREFRAHDLEHWEEVVDDHESESDATFSPRQEVRQHGGACWHWSVWCTSCYVSC